MIHNENSRVKIPAIAHLTRLGYTYLPLKQCKDEVCQDTNIFRSLFHNAVNQLNGRNLSDAEIDRLVAELTIKLSNDDLGRAFYKILLDGMDGLRLIDLDDMSRNTYHVVTELPYQNGDDEFRPDITLLINGLPLAFIEVKKPNNRDGIIAEHKRINSRFKKKVFRRFVNITQVMVFSNNMEYDDTEVEPITGAFYASSSYDKLFFNRFREEDPQIQTILPALQEEIEELILRDNNLASIRSTKEYQTNLNELSPTNRMLTSLFLPSRFLKLLKYGFAYVERTDKDGIKTLQKHLIKDYNKDFGKYAEYYTPHTIATIIARIMVQDGVQNVTVYDPAAGSGTLVLALAHQIGEDMFIKSATSSSTGSIFKGIRINTLLDLNAILPSKNIVDLFSKQVQKLLALKEQKVKENLEIVKLRDWLLPMLMNGQARVE